MKKYYLSFYFFLIQILFSTASFANDNGNVLLHSHKDGFYYSEKIKEIVFTRDPSRSDYSIIKIRSESLQDIIVRYSDEEKAQKLYESIQLGLSVDITPCLNIKIKRLNNCMKIGSTASTSPSIVDTGINHKTGISEGRKFRLETFSIPMNLKSFMSAPVNDWELLTSKTKKCFMIGKVVCIAWEQNDEKSIIIKSMSIFDRYDHNQIESLNGDSNYYEESSYIVREMGAQYGQEKSVYGLENELLQYTESFGSFLSAERICEKTGYPIRIVRSNNLQILCRK